MSTRRKYDKQFKIDVVNLLKSSGKKISEIANDLGIHQGFLSRWQRELDDTSRQAFSGQGNPRDEELARLKKEVAELRMERDILKKAMAWSRAPLAARPCIPVIFSKPEK